MPSNPCCCCSLQTGSKVIGILQAIGAVLNIVRLTVGIIEAQNVLHKHGLQFSGGAKFFIAIMFIAMITSFAFGILLYMGAKNKNRGHCQIWFYANIVLAIFYGVIFILSIVEGDGLTGGVFVVALLVLFYFLWVVHAFTRELESTFEGQPSGDV